MELFGAFCTQKPLQKT